MEYRRGRYLCSWHKWLYSGRTRPLLFQKRLRENGEKLKLTTIVNYHGTPKDIFDPCQEQGIEVIPLNYLKEGAGKGNSVSTNKEVVDDGSVIGKYYDIKTGQYYNTTRATIHYDSKGNSHIVPAPPIGFRR